MRNTTIAGKQFQRLRLDPDFQKLWYMAHRDRSKRHNYIQQARKIFKLSPAWESIFLPIIFSETPRDSVTITLDISQPIHKAIDPVTGRTFYSLPIYPESTLEGVKNAYSQVYAKYKEEDRKLDIRQSDPRTDKIQYLALNLQRAGKSYQEIADEINEECDTFYTKEDIPLLIQRSQEKSLR